MSSHTLNLTDAVYHYLQTISLRETPVLQELRVKTATLEMARMQISPEQGQFMALLLKLMQAKEVLELGTFTGYSALVMAQALPNDGKLITCDVNTEWTDMAKHYWQKANLADKIELRLAPALETLKQLDQNSFDFIFIDADKENYVNYYENCLPLLKQNGLIAIDNVLRNGDVADKNYDSPSVRIIRQLNETLLHDSRVELSMLPVGDGLTLVLKR